MIKLILTGFCWGWITVLITSLMMISVYECNLNIFHFDTVAWHLTYCFLFGFLYGVLFGFLYGVLCYLFDLYRVKNRS